MDLQDSNIEQDVGDEEVAVNVTDQYRSVHIHGKLSEDRV